MSKYVRLVARGLDLLEDGFLIVLLVAICVMVTLQVISRYVLQSSLSWSEELNRAMFTYLVLIGTSVGVRQGSHMGLHFLTRRLPFVLRHSTAILMWGIACLLSVMLAREGWFLVESQQRFNQTNAATDWPLWWYTLAIPFGMGLTAIRTGAEGVKLLLDWEPRPAPSAIEEIAHEYPEVPIGLGIKGE